MAFLRSCIRECDQAGCQRKAVEELLTYRNERYGFYCRRHAQQTLNRVFADEERMFARQRGES